MKKDQKINRKHFIQTLAWSAGTGLIFSPTTIFSQQKIEKDGALDPNLVKEFVIKGHGDLAKTKELLAETPGLLQAAWDWGGGDFETALDGAGHVGNQEIANFLIEKGAKITIFTMAMLGKLEMLKAVLTAFPSQISALGPHKLGLMHHAKKGGENALMVVDYLKNLGLKN
jgi:hypothetical protein